MAATSLRLLTCSLTKPGLTKVKLSSHPDATAQSAADSVVDAVVTGGSRKSGGRNDASSRISSIHQYLVRRIRQLRADRLYLGKHLKRTKNCSKTIQHSSKGFKTTQDAQNVRNVPNAQFAFWQPSLQPQIHAAATAHIVS